MSSRFIALGIACGLALVVSLVRTEKVRAQEHDPNDPFGVGTREPSIPTASPCGDGGETRNAGHEPSQIALTSGEIDLPRSACMRTGGRALGQATFGVAGMPIDTAIGTAVFVQGHWLTLAGIELELGARLIGYQYLKGVETSSDSFEIGPVTVGAAGGGTADWLGVKGQWLAQLRLEIPRSGTELDATALISRPSFVWTAFLTESIQLHTRASLLLLTAPFLDVVEAKASGALGTDLSVELNSFLVATAGAEGQAAIEDPGLDQVIFRGGLRVGRLVVVGVGVPLGDGTADVVAVLGVARTH